MVHSSRSMTPESGNFPLRMREKRVVLPAPLGPTSPTRSPKFTWNEAFSKSVRPPSVILRSRIVSMKKSLSPTDYRCWTERSLFTSEKPRYACGDEVKTIDRVWVKSMVSLGRRRGSKCRLNQVGHGPQLIAVRLLRLKNAQAHPSAS